MHLYLISHPPLDGGRSFTAVVAAETPEEAKSYRTSIEQVDLTCSYLGRNEGTLPAGMIVYSFGRAN